MRHSSIVADQGKLEQLKCEWLDASMADRHGGKKGTGWKYYVIYCVYVRGVNPLPDPRDDSWETGLVYETILEDMAVWIASEQPYGNYVNRDSIAKYVSGARGVARKFYRIKLGLGAEQSRIRDVLKGYARSVDQPPPKEREGCPPQALAEGMQKLQPGQNWRAALTFGFSALARGCEFSLDDSRGEVFDSSQHLTPDDVATFMEEGTRCAEVRMRKRKDLRVLRGKQSRVVIAGGSGGWFDPVEELMEWIRVRRAAGLPDDGPLFCHMDGSSFTVAEVRAMVKLVMESAGLDPGLFGAHSLRIGGATAALAAGVPPTMIRLMGRWSSDIYEIYCRLSRQSAVRFGRAMAAATVTSGATAFHREHFEMLPSELTEARRFVGAWDVD